MIEELKEKAFKRGQNDRRNGYTRADWGDLADLTAQLPETSDPDKWNHLNNAIADAYADGYRRS